MHRFPTSHLLEHLQQHQRQPTAVTKGSARPRLCHLQGRLPAQLHHRRRRRRRKARLQPPATPRSSRPRQATLHSQPNLLLGEEGPHHLHLQAHRPRPATRHLRRHRQRGRARAQVAGSMVHPGPTEEADSRAKRMRAMRRRTRRARTRGRHREAATASSGSKESWKRHCTRWTGSRLRNSTVGATA